MENTNLELKKVPRTNESVDKQFVRKTIEDFRDNLVVSINPFQEIDKYNKSEKIIENI